MSDEVDLQYMYLVEGQDSLGDPVRALTRAKDSASARKKVKADFEGKLKLLGVHRITGSQWDELLKGYGTQYGELDRYAAPHGDYSSEASNWALSSGRPVFL